MSNPLQPATDAERADFIAKKLADVPTKYHAMVGHDRANWSKEAALAEVTHRMDAGVASPTDRIHHGLLTGKPARQTLVNGVPA
jgi:hypothetical protein